jgi:aryl-alcohol dehydrogenase
MRAAVLTEPGADLELREVELDSLRPDEIVVRLVGSGVCRTDLDCLAGDLPVRTPSVLGHEGAGVVVDIGTEVTSLAPGDHVILSFDSCGECRSCQAGHPAYCRLHDLLNYFGGRIDGSVTLRDSGPGGHRIHGSFHGQSSFATHAIARVRNAVKVDADLPLPLLAPLACSVLNGAGAVLNVLRPRTGQAIGVWGAGPVGLAGVMAARSSGCGAIVAVDTRPERLELARDLGATHTIDALQAGDVAWEVLRGPGRLDLALDTVGRGSVLRDALACLDSPGTLATVARHDAANDLTIDQTQLLGGRAVVGVTQGDADPQAFVPELCRLWRAGSLPLERLVTTFSFDDIGKAVSEVLDRGVVKAVLTFEA